MALGITSTRSLSDGGSSYSHAHRFERRWGAAQALSDRVVDDIELQIALAGSVAWRAEKKSTSMLVERHASAELIPLGVGLSLVGPVEVSRVCTRLRRGTRVRG